MFRFSSLFKPNIGILKARKDIEGLIKAVSYRKDLDIRKSAIRALGEIGDKRAVALLVPMVENYDVREVAIKALGKLGDKRAVKVLCNMVDKETQGTYCNEDVISATVEAFAMIKDGQALGALIAILERLDNEIIEQSEKANEDVNMWSGAISASWRDGRVGFGSIDFTDQIGDLEQKGVTDARSQLANRLAAATVGVSLARTKALRDKVISVLKQFSATDCGQETKEWQEWWGQNQEEYLMESFEVQMPKDDGLCSDDDYSCGWPGATIPRGTGYLYITQGVVDFRKDARSIKEVEKKIERVKTRLNANVMFSPGTATPILLCEQGARKRRIDLKVASADAKRAWNTGKAPLRATPVTK
ncbi:MAG: HEAT repeat domain-containing protein [Nitrospirae bacterium]|nr:HEAT repeat domain-containing protein [Nitrospirota bacterium]